MTDYTPIDDLMVETDEGPGRNLVGILLVIGFALGVVVGMIFLVALTGVYFA